MNVFIGKLESNAAAPEQSYADRGAANADRHSAMAHDMSQADNTELSRAPSGMPATGSAG